MTQDKDIQPTGTGDRNCHSPEHEETVFSRTSAEAQEAVPRPWEQSLLRLPDEASSRSGFTTMADVHNAGGSALAADLNSHNANLRAVAEDRILTDSITVAIAYKKLIEARMAALIADPDDIDPDLVTFDRLAAMRDRFEKQIVSAIRTRRALGRPGPVNINVRGDGPQQVNVAVPSQGV